MSAIGGILMFDRAPVDREALTSLGTRLERLGPDGGREVIAGSAGMAYRAFHTNAESRRERQPYCAGHQAVLCFDGRLDNREELLKALHDDLRGEDTDAAIVMAAFLKWRVEGIAKLLGDFALAIWDRRDRAVWLARDCVGARTLYYHIGRDQLVWSTDLAALLDTVGPPFEVNDEYVADLLTRGVGPELTPYVGIHAVEPAQALRIGENRVVSARQFWSLDVNRELRYATDAEYEAHFRTIFYEAVRCRLRSDRPVFAELSGGLDSSSIVCVAHNLLQNGDAAAPDLETVSYVFDEAPTSDERRWIAHVDAWRGRSGLRFLDTSHRWFAPLDDASFIALPNMLLSVPAHLMAVRAAMRDRGGRTLLVGTGGDELLHSRNNPMLELADIAAGGHLIRLHRRIKTWSPLIARPYASLLWHDAVVPNLPAPVQARLRSGATTQIPDWFDERFVARMQLRERMVPPDEKPRGSRPSTRLQARTLRLAIAAVARGHQQEIGGADVGFPYLDKRLLEFLPAIPVAQKMRCGESRSIMRRALRGCVPDAILNRRGKGNPTEAVFRGLAREANHYRRLLDDGRIVQRGYVDAQRFRAAFDRAVEGREQHSARLSMLLTFELWLRAVERRSAAHPPVAGAGARAACATAM